MNFLILTIFSFFFINGGLYFPLKDASKTLNPGFCVEFGKNVNILDISLSFKNFTLQKNSQTSFSIFSIFGDFFYKISKNSFISFGPSLSLLSLQKKDKKEFGGAISFRSFLNFSNKERFISGIGFEFIKGDEKGVFLMGIKLGFIWD